MGRVVNDDDYMMDIGSTAFLFFKSRESGMKDGGMTEQPDSGQVSSFFPLGVFLCCIFDVTSDGVRELPALGPPLFG